MSRYAPSLDLDRLNISRQMESIRNNCVLAWEPRLPLDEIYRDTIRIRFETLLKDLDSLAALPLDIDEEIKERRLKRYKAFAKIPKAYLARIGNRRCSSPYFRKGAPRRYAEMFYMDMGLLVINNQEWANSIMVSEQLRKKEKTVEELRKDAERTAMELYNILKNNGELDKSSWKVPHGIWSVAEMTIPILTGNNTEVYQRLVVGHADTLDKFLERRNLGVDYIHSVLTQYAKEVRERRSRGEKISKEKIKIWGPQQICLPKLLNILSGPEMHAKHLNSIKREGEQDRITYIS